MKVSTGLTGPPLTESSVPDSAVVSIRTPDASWVSRIIRRSCLMIGASRAVSASVNDAVPLVSSQYRTFGLMLPRSQSTGNIE